MTLANLSKMKSIRGIGKRLYPRSRKLTYPAPGLEVITPEPGLNIPETRIKRALEDLDLNFSVQQEFLGGSILGGLKADFVLNDYGIVLDYKGPHHFTAYGRGRDLLKDLAYGDVKLKRITLDDQDLMRLKPRILEIIGRPIS